MRTNIINRAMIMQEIEAARRVQIPVKKKTHKSDLKNIVQLTQQNQPNNHNKITMKSQLNQQLSPEKQIELTCMDKLHRCMGFIWNTIYAKTYKNDFDTNEDDLTAVIQKIKNKKTNYPSVLPPQKQFKKVLVLDLDQTLVHTTFSKPLKFDFELDVIFNGRNTKIYTVKRFGLDSFLFEMSKIYEIVLFTASQKLYADKVMDLIDPKKRIAHRLYRQHCIVINKTYFLKNLRILGRNLNETIIVDDNPISGVLHPENFYKIDPFQGNHKDRHLCRLSAFLKHLHEQSTMLPIREERKEFQQMEIILSEEDTSSTLKSSQKRNLKQRKKQYGHKKRNSEVETLFRSEEVDVEFETTAIELVSRQI